MRCVRRRNFFSLDVSADYFLDFVDACSLAFDWHVFLEETPQLVLEARNKTDALCLGALIHDARVASGEIVNRTERERNDGAHQTNDVVWHAEVGSRQRNEKALGVKANEETSRASLELVVARNASDVTRGAERAADERGAHINAVIRVWRILRPFKIGPIEVYAQLGDGSRGQRYHQLDMMRLVSVFSGLIYEEIGLQDLFTTAQSESMHIDPQVPRYDIHINDLHGLGELVGDARHDSALRDAVAAHESSCKKCWRLCKPVAVILLVLTRNVQLLRRLRHCVCLFQFKHPVYVVYGIFARFLAVGISMLQNRVRLGLKNMRIRCRIMRDVHVDLGARCEPASISKRGTEKLEERPALLAVEERREIKDHRYRLRQFERRFLARCVLGYKTQIKFMSLL